MSVRLSTRDAAAHLGIKPDTLRKLSARGDIPVKPIPLTRRLLVWERADLDAYLESRKWRE